MSSYPERKRRLKALKVDRVDFVRAGANQGAHIVLMKSEEPVEKMIREEDGKFVVYDHTGEKKLGSFATKEEAVARMRQIEGHAMKSEKDATMSAETGNVESLETHTEKAVEVDQGTDTVAKAEFEALRKALEDEQAARKASDERIAKMESERKQAEFVAKAKDLANLGKAEEIGAMLLEASEGMTAENYQLLERTLKAANAQVEKGDLFAQFAKIDADPADADFDAKLARLAKAKVEAGQAKTIELAKLAVLDENPELRAEYRSNR